MLRELSMNALSTSRFTLNTLSLSRNQYLLRDFTINSLSVSRIHLESIFSPNHYELTICFATSLWIHNLIPEITIDSLSFPRNKFEFSFSFEISQWIHCLFCESTLNPRFFAKSLWIHYLLRHITMNTLSILW